MKNKKLIITIIIILVMIIIALVGTVIWGISNGSNFSFFEEEVVLLDESFKDINEITVNVKSYDVEIKESASDDIRVEINGSEKNKDKIKVEQTENELNIYQEESIVCIGLCFYEEEITIYIPEDKIDAYNHVSSSGSLTSSVSLRKGNIEVTSGDINLKDVTEGSIKSTSGNITLENSNNLEVSSTSGDILVEEAQNIKAQAKSGNINITNITNSSDITTTSGDIKVDKLNIKEDSKLTARSGNINVGLETEVFIEATTKSGDIDIDNSNANPTLTITTTSGDITAK